MRGDPYGALADEIERTRFSGAVRVDRGESIEYAAAFGMADRSAGTANTVETRFGIASGTKGPTAVTVMRLVEDGVLSRSTTARSLLGPDLPLIDDAVTVEHLLGHRSGIGDYLDESEIDDITAFTLPVPVDELSSTESYLRVLDGFPQVFTPGERFAYNNGGYVVLALLAERASGEPFPDLVERCVTGPAGMTRTAYLRMDELPGDAAIGYLDAEGLRTNERHMPLLGSGDGGLLSTVGDLAAFWMAFLGGRLVGEGTVAEMLRPRSDLPDSTDRYGLGFYRHPSTALTWLVGSDPGVSFVSSVEPTTMTIATVISNTTEGAWPISEVLDRTLWP